MRERFVPTKHIYHMFLNYYAQQKNMEHKIFSIYDEALEKNIKFHSLIMNYLMKKGEEPALEKFISKTMYNMNFGQLVELTKYYFENLNYELGNKYLYMAASKIKTEPILSQWTRVSSLEVMLEAIFMKLKKSKLLETTVTTKWTNKHLELKRNDLSLLLDCTSQIGDNEKLQYLLFMCLTHYNKVVGNEELTKLVDSLFKSFKNPTKLQYAYYMMFYQHTNPELAMKQYEETLEVFRHDPRACNLLTRVVIEIIRLREFVPKKTKDFFSLNRNKTLELYAVCMKSLLPHRPSIEGCWNTAPDGIKEDQVIVAIMFESSIYHQILSRAEFFFKKINVPQLKQYEDIIKLGLFWEDIPTVDKYMQLLILNDKKYLRSYEIQTLLEEITHLCYCQHNLTKTTEYLNLSLDNNCEINEILVNWVITKLSKFEEWDQLTGLYEKIKKQKETNENNNIQDSKFEK